MAVWRRVLLLCSVLAGCGGSGSPGSDEGGQGSDAPGDSTPSGGVGDRTENPPTSEGPTTPEQPAPEQPSEPTPPSGETPEEPGTPTPPSTPFGTPYLVRDIFPPASVDLPPWYGPAPSSLVAFGDRLFFAANFEDGRGGLWTSDGSTGGTVELKGFPPDSAARQSSVQGLTPVGNQLFFSARDDAQGRELWVTDGSVSGTRQVKDITPGTGDSNLSNLIRVGSRLFFLRTVTSAEDGASRSEVWTSDGSEAGTFRVKDLGAESYVSGTPTVLGGALFFTVDEPEHGAELWRTDGTEAGTRRVKDIEPGTGSAYPSSFQTAGGLLFFITDAPSRGQELWRTDGTEAGTQVVRVLPHTSSPVVSLMPGTGANVFLARSGADHLMRLSSLEPTSAGGVLERDVATLTNAYAAQDDSDPSVTTYAVAGGKLFFGQAISSGGPAPRDVQLWVTDGTQAGTLQLARPLSTSDEYQSPLFAVDDRVLFTGRGSDTGVEPWTSDGTVAGTTRVGDINPGAGGSFAYGFTRVGSTVYFVADDGTHDYELWALPITD